MKLNWHKTGWFLMMLGIAMSVSDNPFERKRVRIQNNVTTGD